MDGIGREERTAAANIVQSSQPKELCLILVYMRNGNTIADIVNSVMIVAATFGAWSSKMKVPILAVGRAKSFEDFLSAWS